MMSKNTGNTIRNPVVLVHGIDDTAAKMRIMKQFLEAQGWITSAISLSPNNGKVGLEDLAAQLAAHIEATFVAVQPVDLIGFSMGGIVSRYYVQRLGGISRIQRLITLSSPHNGTRVAGLRQNRGAAQMRQGSQFLNDLNQDVDMLGKLQFTSIWTPFDLMILPAHSSKLSIGQDLQIPVLTHPWMVSDRRCLKAIANLLRKPILRKPIHAGSSDQDLQEAKHIR